MTDQRSVLLLTSASHVAGQYVENLTQEQKFNLQQLTIVTQSGSLQASNAIQQSFDACFSVAQQTSHHTAAFLGVIAAKLRPGASLTCYEPLAQGPQQAVDQLRKALLLAGFIDLRDSAANQEYGLISVSASKPKYKTGAKASVSLKSRQKPKQSAWSLPVSNPDDDELIDDEDLLTEEDKQKPVVPAASDCEVGAGKKACKNCTCGRADAEAAVQKVDLTEDMLDNPQSACGSCGLGDAFRCASCPYRGLPQFEMGKKIQLGGDFLTADA